MLKTPKMLKMPNNKIDENGGVRITNGGFEPMCGLERTFPQATVLQAYLYINIYRNLFVGLYITGDLADR